VVREFAVVDERERDFEKVFGRDGIWSELLRQSPGYIGSALRIELGFESGRCYKVFDFWRSHEEFEGFRRERQQEIERFSLLLAAEEIVKRETVLGSFYQDDSGWDEGTGLVSA
jgi:heme-degrading monooxygenase HmoA